MGIPIQSSCDMTNPEEQALWALVALPGPGATAPLVLPVDVMRQWSQRLYDCGFRHHPEEQTVKYVPPGPDTDWVMLQPADGCLLTNPWMLGRLPRISATSPWRKNKYCCAG